MLYKGVVIVNVQLSLNVSDAAAAERVPSRYTIIHLLSTLFFTFYLIWVCS